MMGTPSHSQTVPVPTGFSSALQVKSIHPLRRSRRDRLLTKRVVEQWIVRDVPRLRPFNGENIPYVFLAALELVELK